LHDERAVKVERAEKPAAKLSVAACLGSGEEMESPDPAHGAQGDVHRAGPVDAARKWVGRDPVARLGDELGRVPLVAGQPVGLAETGEMLAATQLPWH